MTFLQILIYALSFLSAGFRFGLALWQHETSVAIWSGIALMWVVHSLMKEDL